MATDQLWFVDLKIGNICNLTCRICGSWSSKWAQEDIDYLPDVTKKDHIAYSYLKRYPCPRENPFFWTNLKELLPNIKYFEFTGGEPFLIQQQFDLLHYAVDNGYSKNIEIYYNTNGTVYPANYVELWNEFKYVEISFSINNIGKRFEYERYGAKWDEVESNIAKFNKLRSYKLSTQICLTVNVQNAYYLPELCKWIETQSFDYVHFDMLHDPKHMCITNMTSVARQLVINRLTDEEFSSLYKLEIMRIIHFIQNGSGSDGVEFITKMKLADVYRTKSFLETHYFIAVAMGYAE